MGCGLAEAERQGWRCLLRNSIRSSMSASFDVPELGHYLEYLLPTRPGLDFFDSVPRH
jgi:hypothetical protein